MEFEYGDLGGFHGVNNKHIRFGAIWILCLLLLGGCSCLCWRAIIKKSEELEEKKKNK